MIEPTQRHQGQALAAQSRLNLQRAARRNDFREKGNDVIASSLRHVAID
jgi:hypothetical protein